MEGKGSRLLARGPRRLPGLVAGRHREVSIGVRARLDDGLVVACRGDCAEREGGVRSRPRVVGLLLLVLRTESYVETEACALELEKKNKSVVYFHAHSDCAALSSLRRYEGWRSRAG